MTDDRSTTDIDIARLREELAARDAEIERLTYERDQAQGLLREAAAKTLSVRSALTIMREAWRSTAKREMEFATDDPQTPEQWRAFGWVETGLAYADELDPDKASIFEPSDLADARADVERLQRHNAALAEALRPFARLASSMSEYSKRKLFENFGIQSSIFDSAAAALSTLDAPTQAQPDASQPSIDRVVIWSYEHCMYWCPNKSGYTRDIAEAGLYSREEAAAIISHCGPEKRVEIREVSGARSRAESAERALAAAIAARDEARRQWKNYESAAWDAFQVIHDTANELGCKTDNEEILVAISKLKAERDAAIAERDEARRDFAALRKMFDENPNALWSRLDAALTLAGNARREALEEAATLCDRDEYIYGREYATAIRALAEAKSDVVQAACKTDKQIIDETEAMARIILSEAIGFIAPDGCVFRKESNPRVQVAWACARTIMEEVYETDVMNAIANEDDAAVEESEAKHG